jgi:hypothetical protein
MDVNPINKRRHIEEDVYDEFLSTDIQSEEICNENEFTELGSNDSLKKSKLADANSFSVCINCFIPALYILTISLN